MGASVVIAACAPSEECIPVVVPLHVCTLVFVCELGMSQGLVPQ